MTSRLVRRAGCRRMPWRNGGGETLEIAVHPEGAGLDEFDRRVSMALVASGGPFPTFPSVDGTLCVLEGEGLELGIDGAPPILLPPEPRPLSFPADVRTEARLVQGPARDLNVMTRRGLFDHSVERLDAHDLFEARERPGLRLVVCTRGMVDARDGRVAGTGDVLVLEGVGERRLVPLPGPVTAFSIDIVEASPS